MSGLEEFYKKHPNISENDFDLGLEATSDGYAISDYVKAEQAVQEIKSAFGDEVNSRDDFQAVLSEVHPYLSEGEVNELSDKFASIVETDMTAVRDNVAVDEAPEHAQNVNEEEHSRVLAEIKAGVADQFDGAADEFTTFEPVIVNLADHDVNAEGRDAIKFRDAILDLNKDLATGELDRVTAERSQVVIDESIKNHGDVLLAASEQYPDFVASQIEADAGHITVDVSTDPDVVAAEAKHGEFMELLLEYDQERLLTAQQTQAITEASPQEVDQPLNETQSFGETTPQEVGQAIAEFTRGGFQHIDDVSQSTIFSKVALLEQENAELQRGDNFESVQKNNTAVEQLLVIAALEGSEEPRAVNALNSVNYDMNLLAETPVPTQSYWSVEDQDDIHVGSDRDRQLQSILDAVTEKRELETVLADRYNEALEEPNPDIQSKEIAKLTLDLDELRQEQRIDAYREKRQAVEHDYGMEM